MEEKKADFTDNQKRWVTEIQHAEKHQQKWVPKAEKVLERYRDERSSENNKSQMNILWSNVETLKPAVYFRTPKPNVSRRFKEFQQDDPQAQIKNQVTRKASQVLERALSYSVDSYDFDHTVESVVEDYLLPGRGAAKVLYNSETQRKPYVPDGEIPPEGLLQDEQGYYSLKKSYEEAECEYWYWKDLLIPKARSWKKTPWIAFITLMTRDQLVRRFGPEIGNKIKLDYTPEGMEKDSPDTFKKAIIYEVWSKDDKRLYYISKSYEDVIEEKDPPLNFKDFFPTPRPLMAVKTNGSNIPVPLYVLYQDQARELDDLTGRISDLTYALKVTGVYNSEFSNLEQMLTASGNKLIPVNNWSMFGEKGGIAGAVDFFPIEEVAKTLIALHEARDRVKQTLYEITGIADIIRGSSNPNETATAQNIKGKFASLRLEDFQKDVARYARDLLRLKAEVIAEHFERETLELMTGLTVEPEVMALLRNDMVRRFRIDIETDSTIRADEDEEKGRRVEFLDSVGVFLEKAVAAGQQVPALAPLMGQMVMFAVRGFKVGRDLEESFEQAINQISNQPPPQPPPDPKVIAEQSKAQKMSQDMKMNAEEHQINMQHKDQEIRQEQEAFMKEEQRKDEKLATDILETHQDMRIKRQQASIQ